MRRKVMNEELANRLERGRIPATEIRGVSASTPTRFEREWYLRYYPKTQAEYNARMVEFVNHRRGGSTKTGHLLDRPMPGFGQDM